MGRSHFGKPSHNNILYDEVILTTLELTVSKDRKPNLPPTCKYMFVALWHITLQSKSLYVTFEYWCFFWFRGFKKYLSTFPKWICAFVLPLKDLGCVRASVFKPASQLTNGRRISLAIPVLSYIFKGLSELSHSSMPGKRGERFPTHYVYAWSAQYFHSHRMEVHDFAGV
ncbi:Protein BNI1 [Bienertia sinuspersici]